MKAWSLFSGVGGFDLALQRAGVDVTLQCEIDPWRRRVLASHFDDVLQEEDVRLVEGRPGAADLLCGGFPCQDLSVAGRRAGLDGARSGLFFEFARIAEELELAARGGWIFLENVPGLLSSDGGRDFGIVLQTLADLGLAVAYRILDSRYFGVPQRRRRVFIVGHPRAECARAALFDPEGGAGSAESLEAPEQEVASTLGGGPGGRGWCDDLDRNGGLIAKTVGKKHRGQGDHDTLVVAATLSSGTPPNSNQAGRRREDDVNLVAFHTTQDPIVDTISPALSKGTPSGMGAIGVLDGVSVRRLSPRECERLQGFPDDWTAVDGLPEYAQAKNGSWRCKSGTPDSKRYAAMGDAVTVNTVEWIARRIVASSQ